MHRFFIPADSLDGDSVVLPPEAARQLFRVLRARAGDEIVVLDNTGMEYIVRLDRIEAGRVEGSVQRRVEAEGEPGVRLTLYVGMLKADKLEYVLQKGVELGVSHFVPLLTERTVPRLKDDALSDKRQDRWSRIIREAAEQSRRGLLPTIAPPVGLVTACSALEGPAFMPWEEEGTTSLRTALRAREGHATRLSLLTGPEGGFSAEEVRSAVDAGVVAVTLGKRILRAETAAIATVAAIMYELGQME